MGAPDAAPVPQRLGADRATVESYLGWLRTVFLVHELAPWTRNRAARVIRRPKFHLTDSGLAAGTTGRQRGHALQRLPLPRVNAGLATGD